MSVEPEKVERVVVSNETQADIILNPKDASLKRVAWAYGCAKRGTVVEQKLLEVLLAKARATET